MSPEPGRQRAASPLHVDVRPREVAAFEQQLRAVGLRTRVTEAIAHVEPGGVPPLAELGISLGRKVEFALSRWGRVADRSGQ